MPGREGTDQLVEAIHPVVPDEAAGRARGGQGRQHGLDAVVNHLVADHRVILADEDRQRREVRQCGRLRDDQRALEQRTEQSLELGVRRARDVGA
jgi:hypothetical protein